MAKPNSVASTPGHYDRQVVLLVDDDTRTRLKLLALRRHINVSTMLRQVVMEWLTTQDQPVRPAPPATLFSETE